MKTINKILEHMRNTAIEYLNGGNESHNAYELLMSFHGDIKRAYKTLKVDRDNWRRQALDEYARANAATCEKSSQVGNAAKMREVVAETEYRIDKVISILTEIPDSCGYGGLLEDAADELCDLKEEFVKPALSDPARNCDLYETESESQSAFIDWYNEINEIKGSKDEISTCDLKHNVEGILHDYIEWLFAEAKGLEYNVITRIIRKEQSN